MSIFEAHFVCVCVSSQCWLFFTGMMHLIIVPWGLLVALLFIQEVLCCSCKTFFVSSLILWLSFGKCRFYSKLVYISRLEFLTEYVRKGQVDIPDFVHEHDKELEARPLMDYGLEADPLQMNHCLPMDPPFRSRLQLQSKSIIFCFKSQGYHRLWWIFVTN